MILTRKKAIKLSIELWTWLAEDGSRRKEDWPEWDEYGEMTSDCFLCEYQERKVPNFMSCKHCPYFIEYGKCVAYGSPYERWDNAEEDCEGAEEAAAEFLGQLKQLV